jgi:hypothetical protein
VSEVEQLLLGATCAVRKTDGTVIGTAWLLDDEGHLLTAGHVLGTGIVMEEVTVTFPNDSTPYKATKVLRQYDDALGIDCAVLKIDETLPKRTALPISLTMSPEGGFRFVGYGKTLGDVSSGAGKIVGSHLPQDQSANRLLLLATEQGNEGGYSGAAIFSTEIKAVVAIQIEGADVPPGTAHATTVLAMPLYRIAQLFSSLPVFADSLARQGEQDYYYHVYLSYRRGGVEEDWLDLHFRTELSKWLSLDLPDQPQIFFDHNAKRDAWDPEVIEAIRRSRCLVAISSSQYWGSPTCVAELETFKVRQRAAKVPVAIGLVFHGEEPSNTTTEIDWTDFKDYAIAHKGYPFSADYTDFVRAIKKLSRQLAALIRNAPKYESSWPVVMPVSTAAGGGGRIGRPRL